MTTATEQPTPTEFESVRIATYHVELYGRSSVLSAVIDCRGADGLQAALLVFGRDGHALSEEAVDPRFMPPWRLISFPERSLAAVLDLLRNETPVYFQLTGVMRGFLHTGDEPVGESEILAKLAAL